MRGNASDAVGGILFSQASDFPPFGSTQELILLTLSAFRLHHGFDGLPELPEYNF
jgi:hypothetical protein